MPFHPLSPTLPQMFAAIDMAISDHGFNRIFVASEDLDYVEAVLNRYPEMAITLPHFRTRAPINAYRILPREKHKYLLGKEILLILLFCQLAMVLLVQPPMSLNSLVPTIMAIISLIL